MIGLKTNRAGMTRRSVVQLLMWVMAIGSIRADAPLNLRGAVYEDGTPAALADFLIIEPGAVTGRRFNRSISSGLDGSIRNVWIVRSGTELIPGDDRRHSPFQILRGIMPGPIGMDFARVAPRLRLVEQADTSTSVVLPSVLSSVEVMVPPVQGVRIVRIGYMHHAEETDPKTRFYWYRDLVSSHLSIEISVPHRFRVPLPFQRWLRPDQDLSRFNGYVGLYDGWGDRIAWEFFPHPEADGGVVKVQLRGVNEPDEKQVRYSVRFSDNEPAALAKFWVKERGHLVTAKEVVADSAGRGIFRTRASNDLQFYPSIDGRFTYYATVRANIDLYCGELEAKWVGDEEVTLYLPDDAKSIRVLSDDGIKKTRLEINGDYSDSVYSTEVDLSSDYGIYSGETALGENARIPMPYEPVAPLHEIGSPTDLVHLWVRGDDGSEFRKYLTLPEQPGVVVEVDFR